MVTGKGPRREGRNEREEDTYSARDKHTEEEGPKSNLGKKGGIKEKKKR